MTTADMARVAEKIQEDISRVSSVEAVAREAGLAGPTLRRHLKAPSMLTLGEIFAVARVMRVDSSVYLQAAVEHSSSAA